MNVDMEAMRMGRGKGRERREAHAWMKGGMMRGGMRDFGRAGERDSREGGMMMDEGGPIGRGPMHGERMRDGRMGGPMGHEGREGRGRRGFGGRPGHRIFDHGEVRYVILAMIGEKSRYGYEVIKAIEERLHGAYAPSPGLVYPTLTMLEEMGYATAEAGESGKKLYSLTEEGKSFLELNKAIVDAIFTRMERAAALHRRTESPEIVRAIENLRFTLRLKSSTKELTDAQVRAIAEALDEAARKIEQC